MDGKTEPRHGFEPRAHIPLALLLATGVLAAAAPVVTAEPGGNAASGEHVPPGQAKKAEAAQDPAASPGNAPASAGPASEEPAATETVTPSRSSSSGSTSTGPSSNGNSSKPSKAKSPNSPKYAGSTTSSTGTTARPTTAAPATATATPSTTPPAASAPNQSGTSAGTRAARRDQSSTSLEGSVAARTAAARAAAQARATAAAGASAGDPKGAEPARTIVGERTLVDAQSSPPEQERGQLREAAVKVLNVVPPWMRWALGVLAALGLLLGTLALVQTIRRRQLERQRRLLLADVGVLQSALLPELPERIGGARVTAAYRPADGLAAGGDFYDAFELPGGRTGVLVGDVAGHGRDAVPLTALVRYNLRAYLAAGLPPRATLHVASSVLEPHLGGRQVTIAVAIFDPGSGRLTYACAGHWPPLLLGNDMKPVTVCSSPPVGVDAPTGRRQTTIALAPGSAACFHTDGLDEVPLAFGRLGREGVEEELRAVGPQGRASELLDRVVRRSRRQPDDMAALILEALPGGCDSWSTRLEELEIDLSAISGGWAERFMDDCGVTRAQIAKALREAREIVAHWGTAVIVVRMGEELAEVRVTPPPAITLPLGRDAAPAEVLPEVPQHVAHAG